MRLVFAGTPRVALPSLEAIAGSGHQLLAVLTRPDAPAGRGRRSTRSPVAEWADRAGVPVMQPRRPSEPEFLAELARLAPDCCPVVAYGALIPPAALRIPARGWVNLHFSVLPAWRGAAPVQRAVMAGDEVTGATTFLIEQGLDSGPVYGTLTESIRPRDTAGDLLQRLSGAGARLLLATLDGIEAGTLLPTPQPAGGVSQAPKVTAQEAELDWTLPAHLVDRRIRGCTPEPGAWTRWRGERLGIGVPVLAPTTPDGTSLKSGQLLVQRRAVLVGTGSVPLELGQVQPAGRRPMPAADWARGVRPAPGEGFGE